MALPTTLQSPLPRRSHLEKAVLALFFLPFVNGFLYTASPSPLAYWSCEILGYVIVPTVVFVLLKRYSGLRAVHLGLNSPRSSGEAWHLAGHCLLGSAVFTLFIIFCSRFFGGLYPSGAASAYSAAIPLGAGRFFIALYQGLSAGIVEEPFYRGLLVQLLEQYNMGKPLLVLIASSLFALVHWEGGPAGILNAFFVGLFATLYFLRFRLLLPLILGHCLFDCLLFFQSASGQLYK